MGKENFELVANKYFTISRKLRLACEEYIGRKLKENGNVIEWDDRDLDCSVTISYDGGNHPEYASTLYSTLRGIYMDENGMITFDIEDDSRYDISNVSTDELYDVCDFLEHVYLGNEQ